MVATAVSSFFIYKTYITQIANPCTKWTIIGLKAVTTKCFFSSFTLRAISEYTTSKQDLIEKANIAQYIGASGLLIWAIFTLSSYKQLKNPILIAQSLACMSVFSALAATKEAKFQWIPLIIGCTINSIASLTPRFSLTNIVLCGVFGWLWVMQDSSDKEKFGLTLLVFMCLEIEGFVAFVNYRKNLKDERK
jgi:hypothetical protein